MNKIIVTLLITICYSFLSAQTFEMKTDNFRQTDETTMMWELWIKKTSGDDFGLFSWMLQWSFSGDILNGGTFVNNDIYIFPGADAVFMDHYNSANAVKSPTNNFFSYTPSTFPNTGEVMTLVTEDWKHIATFSAQMSKNQSPHNFASADPVFSHRLNGIVEVFAADNPYLGPGTQSRIFGTLTTAEGTAINTRQLAGYWFSGEGNWVEAARWNNVTTENRNIVPPLVSNNATIAGNCTLTELRIINQLVVAEGGYLVLNEAAELTTTDLYNDNQSAAKNRAETIAAWDFEDTGQSGLPYTADDGIAANNGIAEFSTTATFDAFYLQSEHSIPGWTRAPFAYTWATGFGGSNKSEWTINLSTTGYQSLTLYSKQWSDLNNDLGRGAGPDQFKLQFSLDGSAWTDIGSPYSVGNDGSIGNLSDIVLPSDINDKTSVFIRWINTTTGKNGYSGIEDILITGDEIPPPPTGILIQSTASGTGSLIHNNNDVEATIERYIPATNGNSVYHLVSVPLTQAANPRSGLFKWSYLFNFDVTAQDWVAMGTSLYNPLYVNQGYMIYKYPGPEKWETDTTYSFAGPMNNGSFTCNVAFPNSLDNHNLVPNPYPSAINWDATSGWTKTNVYNAIWIWNPASANYATYINNAGTNGGSQYIPVGQSFFVSASAAAPALIMDNDVRVHNDQAFLKNKEELPDLLRVKAFANNFSDEAVVRFADGATAGFDGQYDASKFYGSPEAPQLFTLSSDDKQLSINAMEVGTGKRIIDLGFKLEATGLCTLNFSGIESFNSDMQIQLNDRVTGQQINLRTMPEYSFAHSPENAALRFELIFDGVTAIADVRPVNQDFFYADGKLYLNFAQDSQGPFDITVYNINGQTEFMGVTHDAKAVVDLERLTSGFHIVRVVTNDYSGEKKVVVK